MVIYEYSCFGFSKQQNLTRDVLSCFIEKYQEAIEVCQNIPLSRSTITRTMEQINKYLYNAAKNRLINCKYFSVSLNECRDINNICQHFICIKKVNAILKPFWRSFIAWTRGRTSSIRRNWFESFFNSWKHKLGSICSDGAKVMRGRNKSLFGILNKNEVNCPAFTAYSATNTFL